MGEHSPGPWAAQRHYSSSVSGSRRGGLHINAADGRRLATVWEHPLAMADALLMASAWMQRERIDELIEVESIYWRALTDVLIGAQQRSQSHADVIALAAGALTKASAIMPLEKRAGLGSAPAKRRCIYQGKGGWRCPLEPEPGYLLCQTHISAEALADSSER